MCEDRIGAEDRPRSAAKAGRTLVLTVEARHSHWVCDVLYACDGLCARLGQGHQLVAAVSLGYADEQPRARPRRPLAEVTEWLA